MFSVNTEFDPEFVINSGVCAPENMTHAANSQADRTCGERQQSVSLIHFSQELAQFTFSAED